jgi:hypothetical protein
MELSSLHLGIIFGRFFYISINVRLEQQSMLSYMAAVCVLYMCKL